MSLFCCDNNRSCVGFAAIVSGILGVVAAFLRITAAITVPPVFSWVVGGIAVGYLAITLAVAPRIRRNVGCRSVCTALTTLLIGILLTVLAAVILLAIPFVATSVVGAIVVGVLIFSVTLMLTATACLVRCIVECTD